MEPIKNATVEVSVKNRLRTHSFVVVPTLLGRSHIFTLEGYTIRIELPLSTNITEYNYHHSRVYSLKGSDALVVKNVDLIVDTKQKVRIPEIALNMSSEKNIYFFGQDKHKEFDDLTNKYTNITARAFEKWTRIMRWKRYATVNGPTIRHDIRVKAPALIDTQSGKQFYFTSMGRWGMSYRITTEDDWEQAQEILNGNDGPQVYIELGKQKL